MPSFYVSPAKNLFLWHGCGRGGDLIRFAQLYFDLPFHQAVTRLRQELALAPASEAPRADGTPSPQKTSGSAGRPRPSAA